MTFISYLIIVFKTIIWLILVYLPDNILKVLIGITLISLYSYIFRKRTIVEAIRLNDYKIKNPILTGFTIIFVLHVFTSTLFFFKLANIGNKVDLKLLYKTIKHTLTSTAYIELFSNGILILGFILLGFLLLHYIKAFILKQFIMLHIYLSKFNLQWCWRHNYHVSNNYISLWGFFIQYDYHLSFLLQKYLDPEFKLRHHSDRYFNTRKRLHFIEKHLGLIIIIISVVYDIIFNNFILIKIYYIFPFTFIYILWRITIAFYGNRTPHIDVTLSTIFYYKQIELQEDHGETLIVYEEGLTISEEDIIEANHYIVNKCIGTGNLNKLYKVIDQFDALVNRKD